MAIRSARCITVRAVSMVTQCRMQLSIPTRDRLDGKGITADHRAEGKHRFYLQPKISVGASGLPSRKSFRIFSCWASGTTHHNARSESDNVFRA